MRITETQSNIAVQPRVNPYTRHHAVQHAIHSATPPPFEEDNSNIWDHGGLGGPSAHGRAAHVTDSTSRGAAHNMVGTTGLTHDQLAYLYDSWTSEKSDLGMLTSPEFLSAMPAVEEPESRALEERLWLGAWPPGDVGNHAHASRVLPSSPPLSTFATRQGYQDDSAHLMTLSQRLTAFLRRRPQVADIHMASLRHQEGSSGSGRPRRSRSRNSVHPMPENGQSPTRESTSLYDMRSPAATPHSRLITPLSDLYGGHERSHVTLRTAHAYPTPRPSYRKWCKILLFIFLAVFGVLAVVCMGYLLYLIVSTIEGTKADVPTKQPEIIKEVVDISVRIVNVQFVSGMRDNNSKVYKDFTEIYCGQMTTELKERQSISDDVSCQVNHLSPGSVVVDSAISLSRRKDGNRLDNTTIADIFSGTRKCNTDTCYIADPNSISVHPRNSVPLGIEPRGESAAVIENIDENPEDDSSSVSPTMIIFMDPGTSGNKTDSFPAKDISTNNFGTPNPILSKPVDRTQIWTTPGTLPGTQRSEIATKDGALIWTTPKASVSTKGSGIATKDGTTITGSQASLTTKQQLWTTPRSQVIFSKISSPTNIRPSTTRALPTKVANQSPTNKPGTATAVLTNTGVSIKKTTGPVKSISSSQGPSKFTSSTVTTPTLKPESSQQVTSSPGTNEWTTSTGNSWSAGLSPSTQSGVATWATATVAQVGVSNTQTTETTSNIMKQLTTAKFNRGTSGPMISVNPQSIPSVSPTISGLSPRPGTKGYTGGSSSNPVSQQGTRKWGTARYTGFSHLTTLTVFTQRPTLADGSQGFTRGFPTTAFPGAGKNERTSPRPMQFSSTPPISVFPSSSGGAQGITAQTPLATGITPQTPSPGRLTTPYRIYTTGSRVPSIPDSGSTRGSNSGSTNTNLPTTPPLVSATAFVPRTTWFRISRGFSQSTTGVPKSESAVTPRTTSKYRYTSLAKARTTGFPTRGTTPTTGDLATVLQRSTKGPTFLWKSNPLSTLYSPAMTTTSIPSTTKYPAVSNVSSGTKSPRTIPRYYTLNPYIRTTAKPGRQTTRALVPIYGPVKSPPLHPVIP